MDMLLPPLERRACSLFQSSPRTYCQIRSSFIILLGVVLVQLAVIIVSFLDGASLMKLIGKYHFTTLEISAILQAYFRYSQVSKHHFSQFYTREFHPRISLQIGVP
jgi:hypothetical protein